MRNKLLAWMLLMSLVLALCACGGSGQPAVENSMDAAASEESSVVLPDAGLHQEEAAKDDSYLQTRRAKALEYLDQDVDALLDALGEPLKRSYAPSCLGDGEDGELQYDGFTVYTYREDGAETVTDVK